MNQDEILKKLNVIFREVFEDDELVITEDTKTEDIEDWDSVAFAYLTVRIEEDFFIELGEEMADIECVKDIVDVIKVKMDESVTR